jgi:hypothetical protein
VDDRRQNDRIDTFGAGMTASNSISGDQLGIIGNLSPGGMMLITTQQLYADGILQVTVTPPPGVGCEPFSMGLKILWCIPANSPAEYWAGLETIDITAANQAALDRLLNHLASHP